MCVAQSNHDEPVGYGKYMLKRAARIGPLHIFCLGATIVLFGWAGGAGAWKPLLCNFLLLQSWVPDSSFYFSGNSVNWCLSDLLFFYLAFPFLYRLLMSKRSLFVSLWLLAVAATVTLAILLPPKSEEAVAWIYIFPATRMADFLSGMLTWRLFNSLKRNWSYKINQITILKATLIELLCLMPLAVSAFLWTPASNYGLSVLWWLPFFIILPAFSMLDRGKGVITAFLHRPVMLWFGRYSFTFYMVHLIVIRVYARIGIIAQASPTLRFAVIFVSAVIVAVVVGKYIERPLGRLILQSFQNK